MTRRPSSPAAQCPAPLLRQLVPAPPTTHPPLVSCCWCCRCPLPASIHRSSLVAIFRYYMLEPRMLSSPCRFLQHRFAAADQQAPSPWPSLSPSPPLSSSPPSRPRPRRLRPPPRQPPHRPGNTSRSNPSPLGSSNANSEPPAAPASRPSSTTACVAAHRAPRPEPSIGVATEHWRHPG